jgi:signal transduction histidine kinase
LLTRGKTQFREVHSITEAVSALIEGPSGGGSFDAILTDSSDPDISRELLRKRLYGMRVDIPVYEFSSLDNEISKLSYSSDVETVGINRNICHDINNLIGASIGYSELALMEIDEQGDCREYVELVLNTLRTAVELISNHFSPKRGIAVALAEGRSIFESEMIDIDRFVRKVSCAVRKMIHSGSELSVRNFTEGIMVMGDESKLVRVMMNLFLNAMESTGLYGQMIFRIYSDDKARLHLEVEDNGPGISEENSERVFVDGYSTRGSHRGHGLAMVREMVVDMGGSIEASKGNLGGALMRVMLPVNSGKVSGIPIGRHSAADRVDDLH